MNGQRLGAVLLVIGLALLAHPFYLFPHQGATEYAVQTERVGDGETAGGAVISIDRLPSAAQAAILHDRIRLWSDTDAAAIEAIRSADYVETQNATVAVELGHVDRLTPPVRPLLTLLAGLLTGFGGLLVVNTQWRPRTPIAAAFVPLSVLLAFQAVETIDAGRIPVINVGTTLTAFGIFVTPIGMGVAMRRRLTSQAAGFAVATLLFGVISAVLTSSPP